MKTPFDDAVAKLSALTSEGFSRGWDRLDRADKIEEIGEAVGGIHAEWTALTAERDSLRAHYEKAHADCQEMIRTNDEAFARLTKVECERDTAVRERDEARADRNTEIVFVAGLRDQLADANQQVSDLSDQMQSMVEQARREDEQRAESTRVIDGMNALVAKQDAELAQLRREHDDADKAAERLVFALHIYPAYRIDSRGPQGCILDALTAIAPDVAKDVREHGAAEVYAGRWDEDGGAIERRVTEPASVDTTIGEVLDERVAALEHAIEHLRRVVLDNNGALGRRVTALELPSLIAALTPAAPAPIAMRIPCPSCNTLHIDEGEFATKPHHTHACQHCGSVWRPAIVATVGVRFLPGFKNETP